MAMAERNIVVTDQDYDRLTQLLARYAGGKRARECTTLEAELERAELVGATEISPDVVTMRSRVRFRDEASGDEHEATLVYPSEASWESGRISILAPVGAALLGVTTGESIVRPMPDGNEKRLRVLEVVYQPEAAGHFDR